MAVKMLDYKTGIRKGEARKKLARESKVDYGDEARLPLQKYDQNCDENVTEFSLGPDSGASVFVIGDETNSGGHGSNCSSIARQCREACCKVVNSFLYMTLSTVFWSVAIVVLGVCLMENKTQFDAPYFTSWSRCSFLILLHPTYFVCHLAKHWICAKHGPRQRFLFPMGLRLSLLTIVKLSLLQLISEYSLCQSLRHINPTVVLIIMSSFPGFRYILFWIILEQKAEPTKIVSALMSIIGIVVMSHSAHSYTNPIFLGVILAAFSSAIAAIQETYFCYTQPQPTFAQRSFMYLAVGACNLCVGVLLLAVTIAFQLETIDFTHLPLIAITASSLLNDGSLLLYNMANNVLPVNILPVKFALAPIITIVWDQAYGIESTQKMKLNTFQILSIVAILGSQLCWIVPSVCQIQKKTRKKHSHSVKDIKDLVVHAHDVHKHEPNFV